MRLLKTTLFLLLALGVFAVSACSQAGNRDSAPPLPEEQAAPASASTTAMRTQSAQSQASDSKGGAQMKMASLNQAGEAQNAPAAVERKIIRNAALTVETEKPAEGQRKITSVAEAHGGFVVTSESKQQSRADADEKPYEIVTITVRVPAAQFDAVMNEIRATGSHVIEEKVTGQDVTEEFIDLEARIRTQKALETQFMEIMKQASRVSDALEVQSKMADVRTEIERLEGRRRFLESQASLSTIKVTLQPPALFMATTKSGFFRSIAEAFGDGLDVAANIVLLLIRVAIALIPIGLFIVLPFVLLVRFLLRRSRRHRLARELEQPPVAP